MPFKNRFLLVSLLILLAVLLGIWLTPFAVSYGVRLWVWWKARQEGLVVKIDKIDAPFLRPVVIGSLHVTSAPENTFHIDLTATQMTVDLNLKGALLRTRGRAIHNLSIQQLHGELSHKNPSGRALSQRGWTTLQKLFPESLSISSSSLRLEDGPTVILLRSAFLSASETEAGRFNADEVMIASPLFRQTFSQLRGATNWQSNRLSLAGFTLTRGLDLQSVTADLSRVGKQRVGLEFDVDAFGGKIRASISHQWRLQHSNWKVAGSAADISLAQTSEAIGFTDRVDGLLHACNFTFRGNLSEPARATASLWTELTGLTWRNRTAEAIMFGAALYNRQIELQQLYIKQRANQLTLSGEASFPGNSSDWLRPDFRGDISASISNLGDFASLFGADPGDFEGKVAIDGAMNARDRKIGGHITASGTSLKFFRTSIEALSATLNLKAMELELEQLELKRKNDFVRAQGKIDMSHEHNYSGTINATVDNLAGYLSMFRGLIESNSKPMPANIQITIDSSRWDMRGGIDLPGSSPLNFTANFLLPIGTNWNAFLASPLNVTLHFPSIFLANAPQFFRPEIFREGILSGELSLSRTLQNPRIDGDLQLVNGKLQNAPIDLTELTGHATFNGDRASLDFVNASTKDVDLSLRGEIDFHDLNGLVAKVFASVPVFSLTNGPLDCASQIKLAPVGMTLAPMVEEFDFRGGFFSRDWTVSFTRLGEDPSSNGLSQITRTVRLCFGAAPDDETLTLGAYSRPQPSPTAPRKRRRSH
jgi:autotransporter translocation and assembly factor TamB